MFGMRSLGSRVVAAMVIATLGVVGIVSGVACSGSSTSCDASCAIQGGFIDVPADLASRVKSVSLAGAACDGVTAGCQRRDGAACVAYAFTPKGPGECDVTVDLTDTVFTGQTTFKQTTGCCAGIYGPSVEVAAAPVDGGAVG